MSPEQRVAAAVAALRSLESDGRLASAHLPYARALRQAEALLGPFATLPDGLRQALVRFYQDDEAVRTLARGGLSRALLCGGAFVGRVLYGSERAAGGLRTWAPRRWRPALQALRRALRQRARQSTHLPFRIRRWLRRSGARLQVWAGGRRLGPVLHAAGVDPRPLGYAYLEGLQQIRGCVSVLREPAATYAQLIGVDFVQSAGVYWFLEANCNPALMDARLALYPSDDDPWAERILDCACARGRRRVVVYGYRPFSPGHGAALAAAGRRRGIEVTIVDDVFAARHRPHRRAWLIDTQHVAGALVVRAKSFDVLFDRAVLSKRRTREIVEPLSEALAAAAVAVPRRIARGDRVPGYRPESPYPSVVAKVDELDRGAGVSFYKLACISPDLAPQTDYFEEYHVPDACPFRVVCGRREALPHAGARAWKIRSYALLTPEGVEYLSSIKVISGRAIPDRLPDGAVAQKSIYLATINEGGVYSAVTVEEDRACRRATEAVGGILLEWLARKYGGDATVRYEAPGESAGR